MKEIEIISKRRKREKHFLQEDGSIIARMYSNDVHYEKDGQMIEIDNNLIEDGDYFVNKDNVFKVYFKKEMLNYYLKYIFKEHYIKFNLKGCNKAKLTVLKSNSKFLTSVLYDNIFDGIKLQYDLCSTYLKEKFVIDDINNLPDKISFSIETDLILKCNNNLIEVYDHEKKVLSFDVPIVIDSKNSIYDIVKYSLEKVDSTYELNIVIDKDYVTKNSLAFPIILDPTLRVDENENVFDVTLNEDEPNTNFNHHYYLGAGKRRETYPTTYDYRMRSLVKFNLPTIGTGSQIVSSTLMLFTYGLNDESTIDTCVDIHRVTKDWSETTATWNNMSNNYDKLIESNVRYAKYMFESAQFGEYYFTYATFDITELTKKWYTDTPNYGILIKEHVEQLHADNENAAFYAKDNKIYGPGIKPMLEITYRNANGLENYYRYESQQLTHGNIYENAYNGNVVTELNLVNLVGSKNSLLLKLFYNTNDVILGNQKFGNGFKLNIQQSVKEVVIDDVDYIEFVDSDGTLQYFRKNDNIYEFEDDPESTIKKEDGIYISTDKNGNVSKFDSNGRIINYEGILGDKLVINYDNNNRILSIINEDNDKIEFEYNSNQTIIKTPNDTVKVNYTNNLITSVVYEDGTIFILYNGHNLIQKIIDIDQISFALEYYEQTPYRVKKVSEYGTNNTLGNYFNIEYSNKITTIIDNKGRIFTISFNDAGNPLTTSTWKHKNNVEGAYSSLSGFEDGTGYSNRLISRQYPIKNAKNLLPNAGFEDVDNIFVSDGKAVSTISEENPYDGLKCLKISNSTSDLSTTSSQFNVSKDKYYTFSAYVKTNKIGTLSLSYNDINDQLVEVNSDSFLVSDDYVRYDVSIFYPKEAKDQLSLNINLSPNSQVYIDNVQLEEGRAANIFNYSSNSDFSNGLNNWSCMVDGNTNNSQFSAVQIDGITAAKITLDPEKVTSLSQKIITNGHKGDKITVSFWYKNLGINTNWWRIYNNVVVNFHYTVEDPGSDFYSQPLNPNRDQWQYFSCEFLALEDYDNITVTLWQEAQANELYITNVSVVKGMSNEFSYGYNENGSVSVIEDSTGQMDQFTHDENHQLVNIEANSGSQLSFEYDNKITDRGLRGITDNGLANINTYDSNGNIISNKTVKINENNEIQNGLYRIRLKGTNKYLKNVNNRLTISEDENASDCWKIEEQDNNSYIISNSIINNCKFYNSDNKLLLSSNYSLFEFEKNENGSYSMKVKDTVDYIRVNKDNEITVENFLFDDNEYQFQFYFELYNNNTFLEENISYNNKKQITETENLLLGKTTYDYNLENSLTSKVKNYNNLYEYEYDEKNNISLIKNKNKKYNFQYNDYNKLTDVIFNDKHYQILYDEFYNTTAIKLNGIPFYTNEREQNNGNLLSTVYCNGDKVEYEYDEFDRIVKVLKCDKAYEFIYGSNAEILKVISDDYVDNFYYDLAKRLVAYRNNYMNINYKYDENNNIINRHYNFGSNNSEVTLEYDKDKNLEKLGFNNIYQLYNYDHLGRLYNKEISGILSTNYEYSKNGKRTSFRISELSNNGDVYKYRYDNYNNITHIYHNDVLEHQYYYDDYNQLIKEDNYVNSTTIYYKYDLYGNILNSKVCKLKTYEFISQNKYQYNSSENLDQLSQINGDNILYDESGNPIKIGQNISLNWTGKELRQYTDNTQTITYKYNVSGIRTSKVVNNVETKYGLEGKTIVFEQKGNDLLQYIRDNDGELVAVKYNDLIYYYVKNSSDDIIQLIDQNANIVAKYNYDSWGNILSIVDSEDKLITDKNHIAYKNPYRYRSYYYDEETSLYYLNSRYYNPKWGRFISPDSEVSIDPFKASLNLYSYADNNPINKVDYDGNISFFKKLVSKIKKGVKKVVNTVKKVCDTVVKGVKKVISTVSKGISYVARGFTSCVSSGLKYIGKTVTNFVSDHFYFEVGFGRGVEASIPIGDVITEDISRYQDYTLTFENSTWDFQYSGTTGIGVSGVVGFSSDYSCAAPKPGQNGNNAISDAFAYGMFGGCSENEREYTHSLTILGNEYNFDTGELFLGLQESQHMIGGFHFKIGFVFP